MAPQFSSKIPGGNSSGDKSVSLPLVAPPAPIVAFESAKVTVECTIDSIGSMYSCQKRASGQKKTKFFNFV